MLTSSVTAPLLPPLFTGHRSESRVKRNVNCGFVRIPAPTRPRGLCLRLQPIVGRSRKQSLSINVTCRAAAQTQTITREAPTITRAPVHSNEKSPLLDDGGNGFPPRDDGGGGGGGGGGGNFSGGFFLFSFLAFLGFMKDNESEEDYRDGRRR